MARIKCKHCNNFINHVNCHVFAYNGGDSNIKVSIQKPKIKGFCHFITVPKIATMFEFDNYEEFTNHISCPICGRYPFKGSVDTHEFAHVVFGESEEETLNGDSERKCRVCGCTRYNACEGGCYWVEEDLCSKCVDEVE